MYKRQTPLALLIIQLINIVATLTFLFLFARRFYQLRQYSHTLKYKNYFPKLRILFFLAYVLLSLTLLIYNLATESYTLSHWYEYFLQGGGGECINSLILLFQLGVLRFQLNKQQPYTRYHLIFFFYLFVLQIARFVFTLLDVLGDNNDYANLIISSMILTDALIQLTYWIIKRQSLPEFVNPIDVQIDDLSYHTRHIQNRNDRTSKSNAGKEGRQFMFIIPFVCFENGKLKIILERINHLKAFENRSTKSGDKLNATQSLGSGLQPLLTRQSKQKIQNQQEVLASGLYTIEQIKKFYCVCCKHPLKNQVNFASPVLHELIHELQIFLDEVFGQESCYNSQVLGYLDVPLLVIKQYQQMLQNSFIQRGSILDKKLGIPFPEDLNAMYFSIVGYKFMWVGDHYNFYFKVTARAKGCVSYPYKRHHDIQQFYNSLKKILKASGNNVEIPHVPKKVSTRLNPDEVAPILNNLQHFIRIVCNEHCIMKIQEARQLIQQFLDFDSNLIIEPKFQDKYFKDILIEPRNYSLQMKKSQSITIFQYKLFRGKEFIKVISKQYEQIHTLAQQFKRWLKNNRYSEKIEPLVSKKQKKQIMLSKIAQFLQIIVDHQYIYKFYALALFLDINPSNKALNNFKQRLKITECSNLSQRSISASAESQQILRLRRSNSPNSPNNRISDIIDDLGNQFYD